MFSLTICFGSIATPLYYREEKTARDAWSVAESCGEPGFSMADDFGQTVLVGPKKFVGCFLDDMLRSREARIEIALHQARTQHAAQQRAGTDPALRAGMIQGGPAMLSPMGQNERGFG